ncbi:MAG: NAD(P)/FAD-dependent oxidoreductase [Porticoccaceae bacterium]
MSKVIIVGAGIGGVSAAHRLQKKGHDITLYEKADFVGGRMKSVSLDGFKIDVGAGILPGAYTETLQLIREAGLGDMMETVKGNCIFLRDGKEYALDMAAMATSMLKTGLISWRSKLSLAKLGLSICCNYGRLTFHNGGLAAGLDSESVADYCRRNFPSEVNDYLLGPFVRTMYLHSPEEAPLAELLWCMKNLTGQPFSLTGGMDALARKLAEGMDIRLNTAVKEVRNCGTHVEVVICHDGLERVESADYCIIATDAPSLYGLYASGLTKRQRAYLENLRYSRDIVITFCLDAEPAIDAILVQVPEDVDPELAALVIDNKKGEGRAPPGKGMVTAHFIHGWGERMFSESDEVILESARAKVARIIPEVATNLETYHIERWHKAATLAECGTFEALTGFMDDIDAQSRVQLCGDYMSLSSVNVAVVTSRIAADNILSLAPT